MVGCIFTHGHILRVSREREAERERKIGRDRERERGREMNETIKKKYF